MHSSPGTIRPLLGMLPLLACVPAALALARHLGHRGRPLESLIAGIYVLLLQSLVLGSLGVVSSLWILTTSVAIGLAGIVAWNRSPPPTVAQRFSRKRFGVGWGVLALWAVPGVWIALALPPTNYDSVAYHLPTLAHWIHAESLAPASFLGLQRYFPMSMMALALPSTTVARSDIMASLVALVSLPVFGLAVNRFGRELGATRDAAAGSALVALTIPATMRTVGSLQPDLMLAGLFICSLAAAASTTRTRSPADLTMFAMCVSLLPGFKTSGWVYAALALAYLVILAKARLTPLPSARTLRTPRRILVGVGLVAVMGFWTIRALWHSALPIPLGLSNDIATSSYEWSVAGIAKTTILLAFHPERAGDWRILLSVVAGSLGIPLVLYLAATCSLGHISRRGLPVPKASAPSRPGWGRTKLLVLVSCLLVYWITPFSADNGAHAYQLSSWTNVQVRFALPFLGCLAAVAATWSGRSRHAWGLGLAVSLVAALIGLRSVYALIWRDIAWSLLPSAAVGVTAYYVSRPGRIRRAAFAVAVGISALLLSQTSVRRDHLRTAAYGPFFGRVQEIVGQGNTIAALGLDRPYPLFGARFQSDVVGRDNPRQDRMLWRTNREQWQAETAAWLDGLRTRGIDYLVTRRRDPRPEADGRGASLVSLLEGSDDWTLVIDSHDPSYLVMFAAVKR